LGAPLSVRLQGCARAQSQPQGQQWRVGSTASQRSDLRPECAKSGHARRSAERSCRSQILLRILARAVPLASVALNRCITSGFRPVFVLVCATLEGAPSARPGRLRRFWFPTSSATAGSWERRRDRILARLRALRSDLIDPTISVHYGRVDKRTGDGSSSSSAAWSTRCAAQLKGRTTSSIATSSRPTRRPASRRHQRRVVQDGQIPRGNCA
jgi:hypothetical protein